MEQIIPDDDNRLRDVCTSCGYIDYQNPKNIVGVIPDANIVSMTSPSHGAQQECNNTSL